MENDKAVLILGAKGMLGRELVRVFAENSVYTVLSWDREEIDLTDFAASERKIREVAPSIILNAVAYNAVDLCETSEEEYRQAHLLNVGIPESLAKLSEAIGATLVHYSTDYVFDGTNQDGYAEDAGTHPLSRYGMTKREGELAVLSVPGRHFVIRLSKLFGKPALSAVGKQSFFEKMLVVAEGKTEVNVVNGERSCFTYAPDLARATYELLEDRSMPGIYHLAHSGVATWYEAAQELFRLARPEVIVHPVLPDAFPRPAERPEYSELLNTKRPLLRDYREALREFISGR